MSKVSAIISAFFAEKYIEERITNLLSQTGVDLELVVIAKAGSYEDNFINATYPDIKLIVTPTVPTIYAAWNIGIEATSGDYITNANSDDRLYPGALAKLAQALDEHKRYGAAYANADIIQKGQITGRYEWREGGLDELVNQGCFLGPFPMWRKSLHEKHGLFDPNFTSAGDYEFWMRCAKGGEKFWHVKETLGAYDKRPDSAEQRRKLLALWETATARARHRDGLPNWVKPYG